MSTIKQKKPVAGTASLSKGLQVLLMLGEEARPMRFTELANRLGLSKGTLHRILAALGRFDLVRFDHAEQVYSLGPRLLALAHAVWGNIDVRGVAASEMERLAAELGEMAGLAQLSGTDTMVVDLREADTPLGVRLSVGRRDPAFCSAAGKILLAYQPPVRREKLIADFRFEAFTDTTITDAHSFESEIELCRARGYAISDQEQMPGVRSVAAPVFAPNGEVAAAIFIAGPTVRLGIDRLHIIGRELMVVGHRITGNFGGSALHVETPPALAAPSPEIRLLHETTSLLGDSPYWSPRDRKLYWVDILKPSVNRLDLETGAAETSDLTELVGFVLDRKSGGSVIATQSGVMSFDFDTGATELMANPGEARAHIRFNDGKCDRAGRLWAGTMSMDVARDQGSLYRLDASRQLQRMVGELTISNGIGWSPDNRTMYFADSGRYRVYAYDFDAATGDIANRRVFYSGDRSAGRPSGLTVDAEGGVWCAMWDGWSVLRLTPDGAVERTLTLPVPRPTSCIFVGDSLQTLVVTSARIRLSEESLAQAPHSGSLFALEPGVAGLSEVPFQG